MSGAKLGKFRRLDLRDIWRSEANEFTPWLAEPEHIELLGDAIGMELQVQSKEHPVGPFRADIVCIQTGTERRVLIENQLEKTDHTHLGQLMTYAAGLSAVTVVWVAETFTEEHRAALDWLNSVTNDSVEFFGLEIELWQIDQSMPAPKFNMIVKPNDWVRGGVQSPMSSEVSETKLIQQQYWSSLSEIMRERKSLVRSQRPRPQMWTTFPIGRANFWLYAAINSNEKRGRVGLAFNGELRELHFQMLKAEASTLEKEIGRSIEWHRSSSGKELQARVHLDEFDLFVKEDWPRQHDIMVSLLERFFVAFSKRVRELPDEDEETESSTTS